MKWEYRDTNIPGNGKDIIYAESKFWFVHSTPCGIAYSDDLINWHDYYFDVDKISSTENLAYGNDLFVVSGDSGSTDKTYFLISKDGAEWEYKILDTGKNFSMNSNTCKFVNNRFVLITGSNFKICFINTSISPKSALLVLVLITLIILSIDVL